MVRYCALIDMFDAVFAIGTLQDREWWNIRSHTGASYAEVPNSIYRPWRATPPSIWR